MKQKEKTLLTTKHFLLVLALIVCVNFLFSEVLPVQPPSGNSHLSVPFTIKGTVSPDKKYYEKDEIVSFSGYIKLNREHIMYIPDKQYHVRTNCFTGYRTRKLEILNSNMDSLFVMDDINDSLFISATAKVTKLTALVDICFNVSRIGYNSSVQHYIDKGIILNPHDPEVIWALQHDEQDFDGISNTSPMSGRHLKKKNYPHSKLETSRLPHNLMYNSELRLWFYHFEHPEAVEIVSLSVDDYGAFYGENSQYAPEIVDDTLMVVHSTNAIGSTGTVFFTYLYDNVEYYYDYEFYIRGSIDIEITFGYEEDDIENFHAGMGRVNIYRCNESNFYDAFEYDSQYLETPGEPYESYDILPNNNQNTCTIDISDFDRGFVGFEIEFQKDFFQLLEQPEDQDNCHPDQWINKKYWVILYHPEVYYSSSYNGNVYLYINFINDEENNYAEHGPNNCGMIYLHDKDVCGAFNVIRQIDRAEDFSTSYLNNPPMNDSLFIFSDFDTDWFYPGYEHKMTTAYFVYSGHPLSHNNQQFIHLYGGDKETYPGNETYQYQLWANNIILHELGHMYHHNFSIVPVSYAGDSGKWHTPPDDNNLSFSYTESVADLISNSIRSQTDAGTETRFDHQLDSTLSGITNSDLYRFNNLYSENNKLPNWDYFGKDLEWPHIGEDFLNHTPNANTLHGAVCSSFWDLYDSTNDIDDWNFDTKTEPISDIWDSIKNTSNIINFCHYFKDNYYSTEIEKAYFDSLMLAHNIQDYLLIEDDAEWNDQAHLVDNDYIVAENTTLTIAPDIEVYFEYDNKITVYGELIIGDNVKFIGNQDRNSVEVYGSLQVGENVEFIAEEGFYWNGLYLNNCSEAITLNSPTFINNKLTSENTTITIDKGYFINTNIEHNYKDLTISKTSFENSLVYAVGSYPMNTNEKLQIDNCFFSNETNDNAIYITSYKNYEIYADTIYTNGTGIFLNESGSGKTHLISNNVIKNYTENVNGGYGIKLYNCYADILGHNKIFNKLYGLAAINTCQLQVAGDYSPPFQEIHNNQSDETLFTHDSFPYKFKYCLIYDDNHDDYYIKCGDHSGRPHFIHNDMQTQASIPFDPNLDLYPSDAYDYEPMWDSGRDGEIAEAELLFDQALEQYDNESYYLAKQTFIEVISLYPDTRFAVASVRSLYSLEQYLENDFESLKNYYLSEPNMSFDDDMTNTSIFFANLCDIKLANFSQAIEHYENIILDPPSMADSIFAIIDAGYTYLIMEGRDSFMGNIPELKPDSRKLFIKKREILLDLLFEELNIDHDPQEDIEKITLHNNYPNPFNPNTTISFSLPEESKVELTIYNIKGQKVRSLVNEEMNRGIHRKLWNGRDSSGKEVSSGVYFFKLNVNGKTNAIKKCLLVK